MVCICIYSRQRLQKEPSNVFFSLTIAFLRNLWYVYAFSRGSACKRSQVTNHFYLFTAP
ncbi:hypothetical protein T492DRAFT_1034920 [Pavlovales sp. CCMP2436]|nr:hypothetical protein T492DRAFT_1034920 [Pavlovales sp. CCMP2436]